MHNLSPAELEARLRLHGLPELGPRRFRRLLEAFGSASAALSAPATAWRALGLPGSCAEPRRSADIREQATAALRWLERAFGFERLMVVPGEGGHRQKAPLSRTRPTTSSAPAPTASTATPISVLSVATFVARLLVSSQ